MANVHICGERLLSMRHRLRKTNEYYHTIIKPTKRSSTYGEHILRMSSPIRRTHAVQLIAVIIVQILHPTEATSAGNLARAGGLFRPGKFSSFPRRQDFPRSQNFRTKTPSLRESPDPSTRTLEPTPLDSHGFPQLHPNVLIHVYPERAGIPNLKGSYQPIAGSSGDISISHLGVSRGHRNVPQTPLYVLAGLFRTPSRTQFISVFTTSHTPHSDRISAHSRMIFLNDSSVHHNASELISYSAHRLLPTQLDHAYNIKSVTHIYLNNASLSYQL